MRGMRRRPSPLQSVGAVLLVAVLAAGCADDADADPEPTTSSSDEPTNEPTEEPTEEPAEGPVAGSGAEIDPADVEAWCGAITPEQLSAATGYEVVAIEPRGSGLTTCRADLSGSEVDVWWGAEPSSRSFEKFEASWEKPAGVYDPTTISLDSEQPAVVALQEVPATAFAATVVEGSNVQARVSALVEQDADPGELSDIAQQVLAVYFA